MTLIAYHHQGSDTKAHCTLDTFAACFSLPETQVPREKDSHAAHNTLREIASEMVARRASVDKTMPQEASARGTSREHIVKARAAHAQPHGVTAQPSHEVTLWSAFIVTPCKNSDNTHFSMKSSHPRAAARKKKRSARHLALKVALKMGHAPDSAVPGAPGAGGDWPPHALPIAACTFFRGSTTARVTP